MLSQKGIGIIEESTLRRLYWKKELSTRKIGERLDCSKKKVLYWMKKHGIKRRKSSHQKSNKDQINENELLLLYNDEDWSLRMLAEKYEVSHHTIKRKLKELGVEIHNRGDGISRAYQNGRKKKIRLYGKENPYYGEKHDAEIRKQMRKSRIEFIENTTGQVQPCYNPEACELIEEYGKRHGYDFQHAENGGEYHIEELGYWVDGYDPEKNVVIEVDEPHHFNENEKLCERDRRRQQEIEEYLNCKFIRVEV